MQGAKSGSPAGSEQGWRDRAVERSVGPARNRAVSRSEQLIRSATELLYENGNLDFTVQEVVERSGLSLRSFYQHFESKDVLLLSVFEETIRGYVIGLRQQVEAEPDPAERLRVYVAGFYAAGDGPNQAVSQALSRYLLILTRDDPDELARVLEPQVSLLSEILEAGAGAGCVRADIPVGVLTVLVTHTLMAAVEMHVLGTQLLDGGISADQLWAFCSGAVLDRSGC